MYTGQLWNQSICIWNYSRAEATRSIHVGLGMTQLFCKMGPSARGIILCAILVVTIGINLDCSGFTFREIFFSSLISEPHAFLEAKHRWYWFIWSSILVWAFTFNNPCGSMVIRCIITGLLSFKFRIVNTANLMDATANRIDPTLHVKGAINVKQHSP